jgi:hypothetical protein
MRIGNEERFAREGCPAFALACSRHTKSLLFGAETKNVATESELGRRGGFTLPRQAAPF